MFTKADAEAYFNGEKQESFIFICVGFAAIVAALICIFFIKQSWGKGAAWPLALIAILQVVVGFTVYTRSDKQRSDIVYKMDMDPEGLKNKELPRMAAVMKNFTVLKYAEISLFIAGVFMFLFFRASPDKQFWMGLGAGLALQAAIMLVADSFAEKRGTTYQKGLSEFVKART